MTWQDDVLTFWFKTLSPKDWFSGGPALDARIRDEFGALHRRVAQTDDNALLTDADTALAAVIVLDQFSRNLGRKTAAAFENDAKALRIATAAIDKGYDNNLDPQRRNFLYMPFMHSESLDVQDRSVELFKGTASESYAMSHRDTIAEFGRYPYRNAVLGREDTAAEEAYLKTAETYGQ